MVVFLSWVLIGVLSILIYYTIKALAKVGPYIDTLMQTKPMLAQHYLTLEVIFYLVFFLILAHFA